MHAAHLVPMIREMLAYATIDVDELDGIAVSSGPGSYTGLRIGVSTAKGLAFARSIKLISVPSLSAIAYNSLPFVPEGLPIIVSRNSRKGEVYIAVFKKTGKKSFDVLSDPNAISLSDLGSHLSEAVRAANSIWLAGEGSPLLTEFLPQQIASKTVILPDTSVAPSAGSVAYLGAISFENGSFQDVETFEPIYLKDFIPKLRTKSVFDRLPF